MTERIDHVAEANRLERTAADAKNPSNAKTLLVAAQVHAQLAIAEQLRIANLIALTQGKHRNMCTQVAEDAVDALTDYHSHENPEMGGWHELKPEIREALGL